MSEAAKIGPGTTALPWRADGNATLINLRLTPRGGRDAIDGIVVLGDGRPVFAARVRAVAEDGKANAALIALLATELRLPARDITLVSGQTSRVKTLHIAQPLVRFEPQLRRLSGR